MSARRFDFVTALLILILSVAELAWAQPYEGFGASTPGGSAGAVVEVTTLADSGPGSLRDALSQSNRTIVFTVGGTIELATTLFVNGSFITIDGFSAPAPGITLNGAALVIRGTHGAHDVIVRGLRVRNAPLDGIQVANSAYNIVIDHVSVHGSGDGNIDITESSHDVTVSWSILAAPATEKNMLIKYNASRITLHHNLFVDSTQRNPIVSTDDAGTPATDTTVDIRNNLVWNWGFGFGTMIFKGARANVVANFTSSPGSGLLDQGQGIVVCDFDCDGDLTAHSLGYVIDNLSGDLLTIDMNVEGNVLDPFPAPAVTIQDAYTAAADVLDVLAGAGVRPLDTLDDDILAGIVLPPRPDGPNLSVSFFSVATLSDSFTITDRATNSGTQPAGPSMIRFFLSTDAVLDPSDLLLASRSIDALDPHTSSAGAQTVPFPSGVTGAFFLIARADADHEVTETSEVDNGTARAVTIAGPDLLISALSVPTGTTPGSSISVSETTRNQGTVGVGSTTTQFFLSTNAVLDAGDVPLGARTVPSLGVGKNNSKNTSLPIPSATPSGTYFIIAKADAGDTVSELSETNNTAAQTLVVGGDLTILSMTAPLAATPGTSIKISDKTKNVGVQVGPTTTRYILSTDPVPGAGDVVLGSRPVPTLASGAINNGPGVLVVIPAGTAPGTYHVIAAADADNVIAEADEGNNALAHVIEIGLDLSMAAFTAPAAAAVGATISVNDTTKNVGSSPAPASVTAFFVSTESTLTASAIQIGSRTVQALAPGQSKSATTMLTLPAGLGGDLHIFALANAEAGIGIGESGNNVRSRTLHVGPDFVVSSLTTPSSAAAGATIPVSDVTRNNAAVGAPESNTSYFLSKTSTLGFGAILLGARAVPQIGAGGNHPGGTSVTIPLTTVPGSYHIIAKGDGDDAIVETTETNNTRSRSISIVP